MNRTNLLFSAVMLLSIGTPFAYAVESHQKPEPAPHARHDPAAGKTPTTEAPKPPAPIALGAELDAKLSLVDATGRTELLKDLRGKTVVLHFFGTRSSTSTACAARLKALSDAYASKGVQVIGVDSNADDFDLAEAASLERVQAWATKNGLTRVMFDKDHALADRLHATVNGHTFIVDPKGCLRYTGPLDDDAKGEHADRANNLVRGALDAVLADMTPDRASAPPVGDPIVRAAKAAPPVAKPAPPAPKPATKPATKKDTPAKHAPKKGGTAPVSHAP